MSGLVPNDRYSDKVISPVKRQRRSLFLKYFVTLFAAVVVPLTHFPQIAFVLGTLVPFRCLVETT